jgi:large subunit ribosomal protein L19
VDFIDSPKAERLKSDISDFRVGDTIRVYTRFSEDGKERAYTFGGVCISRGGGGIGESFTVRRIAGGVGVERTFLLHSPMISKIDVERRGRVRRAKLNYLRARSGKAARIKERGRY